MKIIYADTNDELIVKSTGLFHDHCHHIYRGKTSDISSELKYLLKKQSEYVFIFKEDVPYKK